MANHFNVIFKHVNSLKDATDFVKGKEVQGKLAHVVLAGHGNRQGVWLGEGDGVSGLNGASGDFLRALRLHLDLTGDVRSTVLLDSCNTGEPDDDRLNAAQRIAMALPGAEIRGWDVSISNIDIDKNFKDIPHWEGKSGKHPLTFMYKNGWIAGGPDGTSLLERAKPINVFETSRQRCAQACAEDTSCPGFGFEMSGRIYDWSRGLCVFLTVGPEHEYDQITHQ